MKDLSNKNKNSFTKAADIKSLEDALLNQSLISPSQLSLVKEESVNSGKSIEQILVEMNLVSNESIARAKGSVLNIPYVNLRDRVIPPDTLFKIPEQVARNYRVISFGEKSGAIQVAMEDPKNLQAQEALEFIKEKNNYKFELYIVSEKSIEYALGQYGSLTREIGKALEGVEEDRREDLKEREEEIENKEQLGQMIQDAPVSKAVNSIVKYAVQANASDIHIEPTEKEIKVRYRIDGVLQDTIRIPKALHAAIISRIKILSNLKIDEQRLPQDGRYRSIVNKRAIDFRVSTFPTSNGEKIVMRILDKSRGILTLEKLGMRPRDLKKVQAEIEKPHGMLLATGPTGSGKTTTLYSVLSILNDEERNILTLEDPIEYFIEGVNQSQVNPSIGYTFASGIRSIVRQDPDVIMVGEIRDFETADMAIHAALTGHIVLSTLHTNDASGAIPRLIDMGVEPFLIASSVNGVIAQRLTRKICEHCKIEVKPTREIADEIRKALEGVPKEDIPQNLSGDLKIWKGAGCDQCKRTGYQGRIGIFEFIPVTVNIESLAIKKAIAEEIRRTAIEKDEMTTLRQDGIIKVLAGITTMEEVWRVTE